MHELLVGKNDAGQRLDKFLQKSLYGMPLSLMYRLIRQKKIKVNRRRAENGQMLCEGDRLQLFIGDEFFTAGEKRGDAASLSAVQKMPDVLYEDENIMLLCKRPGVLVHDDAAGQNDTLLFHAKAYLYQKGEYDPEKEQSFAPALCNRIDRNTGGIVILAKNAEALRVMNEKIRDRKISKFYLCAVHGILQKKTDTLHAWLKKDSQTNTVKIYDDTHKPHDAKSIATRYRVLAEREGDSLLEVDLLTGRTHQIRAQFAAVGHPLLGDGKYGVLGADKKRGYKYQALYAYRLRFDFSDDGGPLGYLAGKTFELPIERVWFVSAFADGKDISNGTD
ncbi:MAG: RluA family pseudouridine synthase [Clostridia bacterium]|nr:RluA family pseudouridine synthase [Clostridia bacterium]